MWVFSGDLPTYPLVLYYNAAKQRIGQEILRNTENGIMSQLFVCVRQASQDTCRASRVSIFESIESFVEEFSEFSDLVLENFRYIFLYHFLICSLVFVTFGVHCMVKFARRNVNLIRRLLEPAIRADTSSRAWLRRAALTLKQRCVRLVKHTPN